MSEPKRDAYVSSDEMIEDIRRRHQAHMESREELRRSPGFVAAAKRTEKLASDFCYAINFIGLTSTQHERYRHTLISLSMQELVVDSVVAIETLIREGQLNVARREMRFLLEASIKAWWCDGVEPSGDVGRKVEFLDDLGLARFREVVTSITPHLMDADTTARLFPFITNLYAQLSTHVHASSSRVAVDLNRLRHGKYVGFETTADVNRINELFMSVLDIALAAAMESFDRSLVGDIFVGLLDDKRDWAFHRTPFCRSVSAYFDYKAERKHRVADSAEAKA